MFRTVERALAERARWRPDARDEFAGFLHNRDQYRALIRLFGSLAKQQIDDDQILIGALAVYGWMPTMMPNKNVEEGASEILRRIVNFDKMADKKFFFLRSRSATTKFLHFYRPQQFYICDSRVKNALGWSSITMSRYLDYCEVLRSPEAEGLAASVRAEFTQPLPENSFSSPGAVIEAALYCSSNSDRKTEGGK